MGALHPNEALHLTDTASQVGTSGPIRQRRHVQQTCEGVTERPGTPGICPSAMRVTQSHRGVEQACAMIVRQYLGHASQPSLRCIGGADVGLAPVDVVPGTLPEVSRKEVPVLLQDPDIL